MSALGYYHATYLGSNFAPYVALVVGGIAALLGYSALLGLCVAASIRFFAGYNPDKHSACVFISLPPLLLFVFQRASILESAAFAFLFASPVIAMFIPAGRRVGQSAVRKMLHPRRVEVY